MKKLVNNKRGFTLVEIMCVVAMIIILASALIVSVFDTYNRSKTAVQVVGAEHQQELADVENQVYGGGTASNSSTTNGNSVAQPANSGSTVNNAAAGGTSTGTPATGNGSGHSVVAYNSEATETTATQKTADQVIAENVKDLYLVDDHGIGRGIVSGNAVPINEALKAEGITNVEAFVTNGTNTLYGANGGDGKYYASGILDSKGVNYSGQAYCKIVSVTTDGTVLADHKKNDQIAVHQYLYYKEVRVENKKKVEYVVLYAERDAIATVSNASVHNGSSLKYDASDTNGSSWTVVAK